MEWSFRFLGECTKHKNAHARAAVIRSGTKRPTYDDRHAKCSEADAILVCMSVTYSMANIFRIGFLVLSPMERCKLNDEQLTMVRAFRRSVLKWYIVIRMPSNLVLPTTSSHEILSSAGHCNHRRYGGHTPQTNMYFFPRCA